MRKAFLYAAAAVAAIAVALAPGASKGAQADPLSFTDGNATYTVNDEGTAVTLTSWDSADTSEEITIPETATDGENTYDVTAVGENVFAMNETVNKITIPATVTALGDGALAGENLKDVTLLGTTACTLGTDVFNAEAKVTIPADSTGYDTEAWSGIEVVTASSDAQEPEDTPTPTPEPSVTDAPVAEPDGTVADFVERLYNVALGRPSEPEGKADWIDRVTNGGYTGADLAHGFLFSPEFLDKKLETSEFLDVLYRTFFDREADEYGKADWTNRMANGWTARDVIDGFIGSDEWAELCAKYGIESGREDLGQSAAADNVTAFVTRLYSTCLGRTPDANGLTDWSNQLKEKAITGTAVARGFFFSPEFLDAHYSDAEYVTRLYRTFLNRTPDTDGFNDWTGRLAGGTSREDVFYGFANSDEFGLICDSYGILR